MQSLPSGTQQLGIRRLYLHAVNPVIGHAV